MLRVHTCNRGCNSFHRMGTGTCSYTFWLMPCGSDGEGRACHRQVYTLLERCRDGSYTINTLRCDVWVVCACIVVCIVACFIGFSGTLFWWKCIST